MVQVIEEDELSQLKALLWVLARAIDEKPGARDLAQLAKQYRETLARIAEMEGMNDNTDEISEILEKRKADGKSDAIR